MSALCFKQWGSMTPQARAESIAKQTGDTPRRVLDTQHKNAPAWLVSERPSSAVLLYDDEPLCVVMAGNHPGRYILATVKFERD